MSKDLVISVNLDSIFKYVKMLNGVFDLTPNEITVLCSLIKVSLLGYNPFDSEGRKHVLNDLSKGSHKMQMTYLNNSIFKLKKKKAIKHTSRSNYSIHPILIPKKEGDIVFKILQRPTL